MINKIRVIINSILIIIFCVSSYLLFDRLNEYRKTDLVYEKTKEIKEEIEEKNEAIDLTNVNSDYRGWIEVENTNIDYPIVQGKDNEYYLDKDINNEYLYSGSIFLDFRNNGFGDQNTIIYGHMMKNNTMFGQLKKFKNKDFFDENKYINIMLPNGETLKYEIFSVYITDIYDEYLQVSFPSEGEQQEYLVNIKGRSLFSRDIDISNSDKILTLSTCSYEYKDARFVVHGKLIFE